jgi:acyl-coenzyme A synthetase/AMP-(fatty) acid ligase
MRTLPLLPEFAPGAVLAYCNARPVTGAQFLGDVLALAERLPSGREVLNLCMDRYWFAVALFAAISRGTISLLPHSAAIEHIAVLCADASEPMCLGDQPLPPLDHLPYLRVGGSSPLGGRSPLEMPRIPFEQCIARVFTSGSTKKPVAHDKTFGRMYLSAQAEARRLRAATGAPSFAVVGAVPFRHMFGLESTVLLPVWTGGQLSDKCPLFPADVASALNELPAPRLLVTSPYHLCKLLEAEIEIPQVTAILSATAPLSLELAAKAESRTGAPMMEIYGTTETGQLAMRRASQRIEWETFEGIGLYEEGDEIVARGGHLESAQVLNDTVELVSPSIFRLVDRTANMINIVGKRSSLAFLNHVITSLPNVRDAIFCLPEGNAANTIGRLAAFVVAPGLQRADILAALRLHLDPVFLPRPIVLVDALPRDGNGKISAADMRSLIEQHIPAS